MRGYQDKTIKKQLKYKLAQWFSTIDDDELKKQMVKDVIVTGGSIASMIMGDPINDYDVYFRTYETTLAVANYYVKKFRQLNPNHEPIVNESDPDNEKQVIIYLDNARSGTIEEGVDSGASVPNPFFERVEHGLGIADFSDGNEIITKNENEEKERYRPIFLSENAITLSDKVQVVIRFYGEPEDIHKNFDFIHAMCYYDLAKDELGMPLESIRSMQSKTLIYSGSLYPICSLFRIKKFVQRGWNISAGQILKIALQISELDLKDAHILKEQLVGVDALYFYMLLEALRDVDLQAVDNSYVCEVIDRIFND